MEIPDYVSKEEVRKVCRELGISDWSTRTDGAVSTKDAQIIFEAINPSDPGIHFEEFRKGMEIELEHGTMFKDANITNNHPLLTGMIVLAHLDYYLRLEVAEIGGDIFKALQAGDAEKVAEKQRKLIQARLELAEFEKKQLG